jgi:hypothetical protein
VTYPTSTRVSFAGIFCGHSNQDRSCGSLRTCSDHGLGNETARRTTFAESGVWETNVTTINAPFVYVNLSLTLEKRAFDGGFVTSGLSRDRVLDNLFALSLTSPNTSKNGTQIYLETSRSPCWSIQCSTRLLILTAGCTPRALSI